MEDEFIRYRQAKLKQKFLIAKKFSKFYLNNFKPITKLEHTDIERSRYFYRAFTVGASVSFGFVSFKYRRITIGALGDKWAARESELAFNIMNDLMMATIGYFCGHLMGCDYIYKHRQYVL